MVLQFEKAHADEKSLLRSYRNLYRTGGPYVPLLEMIVHPGEMTLSTTSSLTGLLSMAVVGFAVAAVIQIASDSSLC